MNYYVEILQFIFQIILLQRKNFLKLIIMIYFQIILRALEERMQFAKNIFN